MSDINNLKATSKSARTLDRLGEAVRPTPTTLHNYCLALGRTDMGREHCRVAVRAYSHYVVNTRADGLQGITTRELLSRVTLYRKSALAARFVTWDTETPATKLELLGCAYLYTESLGIDALIVAVQAA